MKRALYDHVMAWKDVDLPRLNDAITSYALARDDEAQLSELSTAADQQIARDRLDDDRR